MRWFPWVPLLFTLLGVGVYLLTFARTLVEGDVGIRYRIERPSTEVWVFTLRLLGGMLLGTAFLISFSLAMFLVGRTGRATRIPGPRPAPAAASKALH